MNAVKGENMTCACEIVGKDAAGNPLPACRVQGFRYYGGRCAADAPRIVAECWTCKYTDLHLDGDKVREVKPADLYACRLWSEVESHRAAGHDVREVKRA